MFYSQSEVDGECICTWLHGPHLHVNAGNNNNLLQGLMQLESVHHRHEAYNPILLNAAPASKISKSSFLFHEILIALWRRRGTRKGLFLLWNVQGANELALCISQKPRGGPWALPALHENEN